MYIYTYIYIYIYIYVCEIRSNILSQKFYALLGAEIKPSFKTVVSGMINQGSKLKYV